MKLSAARSRSEGAEFSRRKQTPRSVGAPRGVLRFLFIPACSCRRQSPLTSSNVNLPTRLETLLNCPAVAPIDRTT